MSSKLLTVVFVVLFIFLVGEVVYLFFPTLINPVIRRNMTNQNQTQTKPSLAVLPKESGKQAIGSNVLGYLSKFNSGVLQSSVLKNHYEGVITGVDNKHDDASASYSLSIRFEGSNKAANVFSYSLDEVRQKISVYRFTQKGKDPEKVTVDDIKVGNLVSIDEELNLLENDLNFFLLSVRIIVNK